VGGSWMTTKIGSQREDQYLCIEIQL